MADDYCIVNICFHGVGTPARQTEPGEEAYWIDEDTFLRFLDAIMTWPSTRLSFDDGNASDAEIGLPALAERGLRADFFVLAGRLRQPGSLDEHGVRELLHAGMGVGTHGMRHRSWRGLDDRARHEELVAARERLAEVTQAPVVRAACPFGQYDRGLIATARRLGYEQVYTSDRRLARPAEWLQPRFSVRRGDTPESLQGQIAASTAAWQRLRATTVGAAKRWR